jgi:hypothetical protein
VRPEAPVLEGDFNREVRGRYPVANATDAHCQVRAGGQAGDGLRNLFRGFETERLGQHRQCGGARQVDDFRLKR